MAASTSGWSYGLMPEQAPGHGGGELPRHHLGGQAAGDRDLVFAEFDVGVRGDEADHQDVGGAEGGLRRGRPGNDRQHAGAELAGGFGDELFGPVGEALDAGAVLGDDDLVAQRVGAAQRRAEGEADVLLAVLVEDLGCFLRFVQERLDVHAGQAARHHPERGERRVASADVGVRVEDGTVAGLAGGLVQRRARIGDDDDPALRVESGLGEGVLEDPALRVRLQGGAGLGGHHDRGFGQPVREGGGDLFRIGAVQHGQLDAGGSGDDLGGQRGSAHAAEDNPADALGAQGVTEGQDVRHERLGDGGRLDPAEPDGRLGLGVGAPQGGVLGEDPGGDLVFQQGGQVLFVGQAGGARGVVAESGHGDYASFRAAARAPSTSASSSFQLATNLSRPSDSSTATTSL